LPEPRAEVIVDYDASRARYAGGAEFLKGRSLAGKVVLFLTGWSAYWRTELYFGPSPFLTRACCEALLDGRAMFAGIDSLNIDDTGDPTRPAHTLLLGAGVPVCEHMTNLEALGGSGGWLHAVPIAWKGGASFPVRAYVML
jgi:arylformamidase